MIEFTPRSGPPVAMDCPAFICDACRVQVVGKGNIYWVQKVTSEHFETSPIFVGHKGRCGRAVERLMEQLYPHADGWTGSLFNELEEFVKHLSFNAVNAFVADSDGTYHDHKLVQPGGVVLPTFPDVPDTRRHRDKA